MDKLTDFMNELISKVDNEAVRQEIGKELPRLALLSEPALFAVLVDKVMEYPDGVKIIRDDWKTIYNNSKYPAELLERMMSDSEVKDEALNDFEFLLKYGNYHDTSDLAKVLAKFDGGNQVIATNFDSLIKGCRCSLESIVIPCLENEDMRKRFKEDFEKIKEKFLKWDSIEDVNIKGFFSFIRALEKFPEFKQEYEEYIFWADLYDQIKLPDVKMPNQTEIFKLPHHEVRKILETVEARHIKNSEFSKLLQSEDREEKKIILQEVANGNEYQYKGVGSSSFIIQAGDQVVKLGAGRRKFEVPYHPRIMMPYFRKKYTDGSCLEVFNYGNVESADITDDKLLEIYKELENAGILWGDARKDNLLVLLKDNVLPNFIKSKEFGGLLGFLEDSRYPTNKHLPLKVGDVVVCDLDMLYVKGDPSYQIGILDDVIEKYLYGKKTKENNPNLFIGFDLGGIFDDR